MTNTKTFGKNPAQNPRQRTRSRPDKRQNTQFRRQDDISVRESEKRFREAFEHAPIGMVLIDLEGQFQHVNDAYCRITGYTREELLNRELNFRELTHPDDIDATLAEIDQLLINEISSFFIENRYLRSDGETLWVRVSMTLHRNDAGRPYQLVCLVDDISARKQAEEALRHSRDELEQRVRERTVELENRARQLVRLTTELTTAEQRERRRLAETLHDHLQQLLVAARMQIEQLREESNVSESRSPLDIVHETLNEAITSTRSLTQDLSPPVLYRGGLPAALKWLARDMHQKQQLKIRIHSTADVDDLPEALNVFLFTAARELLFNVVKHAGTPEAVVRLFRKKNAFFMEVSDKGRGFETSALLRGDTAVGFGLFSMRERIEFLGGELTVESHPGNGSRFMVKVPIIDQAEFLTSPAQTENRNPEPADAIASGAVTSQARIRVLLVDDHRVMREGLMTLLQGQDGMEVVGQADNGRHAIECIERFEPDVVTMDVSMPIMDGIEATRIIKQRWPKIRIIGLSMFEEAELAAKMHEAGADVYLSKTDPSAMLVKAIRDDLE